MRIKHLGVVSPKAAPRGPGGRVFKATFAVLRNSDTISRKTGLLRSSRHLCCSSKIIATIAFVGKSVVLNPLAMGWDFASESLFRVEHISAAFFTNDEASAVVLQHHVTEVIATGPKPRFREISFEGASIFKGDLFCRG